MKYRLAAAALIAQPTMALAHGIHAEGFSAGLSHPFGGVDHLLTMVLVGVFGVMLGRRMIWATPLAFVGAMAIGLAFARSGLDLSWTEIVAFISPLGLGLALLLGKSIPRAGALALVGGLGFCHGHVHGIELGSGAVLFSTAAGVLLGTAVLHTLGVLSMKVTREGLRESATKAAGILATFAGVALLFT
jgi:urease accessory protein